MRAKKTELNVDFIGGEGSLTEAEERALSEYFKQRKLRTNKSKKLPEKKSTRRSSILA